jgi:hypothetical protein
VYKISYSPKKYEAPTDIDFKTQLSSNLHKKLGPKTNAVPSWAEYYEIKRPSTDSEGDFQLDEFGNVVFEYINLVARIDFELIFDSSGFILEKKAILKWYREDETISSESKNIGRLYDPILDYEARISEGKLRREAIVDGLQLPVLNRLAQILSDKEPLEIITIGREFMDKFDEDFRDFIDKSRSILDSQNVDFGKKVAWVKIRDYSDTFDDTWLDYDFGGGETIRQLILNELDI